jgi:hypothetical protein
VVHFEPERKCQDEETSGMDEAKEQIMEFVKYLKEPAQHENLFSDDKQDSYGLSTYFPVSAQHFWRRDPLDFLTAVEDSLSNTCAEDFYAWGDLRDRDLKPERPSPSNLTPVRQDFHTRPVQLPLLRFICHRSKRTDSHLPM